MATRKPTVRIRKDDQRRLKGAAKVKKSGANEILANSSAAFLRTALRTGFHLTLSEPMMEMLTSIEGGMHWARTREGGSVLRPNNVIATQMALVNRGLVIENPSVIPTIRNPRRESDHWVNKSLVLTPIGKVVLTLFRVAGIYVPDEMAQIRKARG
jgi:hypothetical protein